MPLEVVVELQIRAVSCPGVFLPSKQDVYLGVYFLNQHLETDCFPPVFPIMIHQNMRFQKVFKNAIDPGAVADILEGFLTRFELIQLVPPVWERLAYYEENTRDFLFPEPKLRPSPPGTCREVLMRTAVGFPGIAPKLEFSTRTAIRERGCLHRNRSREDKMTPQRLLPASPRPVFPLSSTKIKPKGNHFDRLFRGFQCWAPSPYPTRHLLQDQPTHLNFGNSFKTSREVKPPFVVRHVDSAKPFGETLSDHRSRKSGRKCKLSNFAFPMRRDSSKFGKPLPSRSSQVDADCHWKTSFATSQDSRSPIPVLDQPLLRERFHPSSQSTWKEIHQRVCRLLTSHRAQRLTQTKEDRAAEGNSNVDRRGCRLKKCPLQRYF